MSINDRIALILQDKNLTANEFAARLKVQSSNISHIITGRNKPSFAFLEKLAMEFPEISTDWLIRGDGTMYISDTMATIAADKAASQEEDGDIIIDAQPYQNTLFDLFDEKPEVLKEDDRAVEVHLPLSHEPLQNTEKIPQQSCQGIESAKIKNIIVYYSNGSFQEFLPK